ncbi:MAG: hypothetical protein KKB70_09855 [Proteobacteria bacterium]|nr:hypothetical protein [Pseudomonadota bacterium]
MHDELACQLGIARTTVRHPGTLGVVAEDKWIKMLASYLPKRYAVNRAFVIDSLDQCSDQIDIVIHDRQYSPFVLDYDQAKYVPAESVYAVLEVKQSLNANHVKYAAEKIASVRSLHRTSLPIPHAGGVYPAKPPQPIIGGLVALDSDWNPPFGDPFRQSMTALPALGQLDLGCAALHGVFQADYNTGEAPAISADLSEIALALFLMRLIARLQASATVPAIDVLAYTANIQPASTPKHTVDSTPAS